MVKKERTYRVKYWHGLNHKLIDENQTSNSKNDIYKSLYENNHKPLSVTFIGWC